MATRNAAASAVLALMFASLVVIYNVVPQNDLVTFLSVVIMAIGLIIAVVGDRDEVMIMGSLSALISLVAAYFWGDMLFGRLGAVVATVAWGILLLILARRASAETVVIPEDHAFMVAPFLSSEAYQLTSAVPLPTLGFLDRHVATIPTYELTSDVTVENVNTRAHHDIGKIEVHTRYQVADPARTLRGIPNRGQIQSEIAKDQGKSLSSARLDVAFWEKLLVRQMEKEVDDIVRKVVFEDGNVNNLVEAYNERANLSRKVKEALQELVSRWGVVIIDVALDFFVVERELVRSIKGGDAAIEKEILREQKKKRGEAESEADRIRLTGEASNERIRSLIEALKRTQPELTSDQIESIVVGALLSEMGDDDDLELERMLLGQKGAPSGAKPPESGGKK